MAETNYGFTKTDRKTVEQIIEDDHVAINHMVLPKGDALPEHYANSHVYLIVVRGKLTLRLNGEDERSYPAGSIVAIPYQTRMQPRNQDDDVLEFFVVKAPSPKTMKQQGGGCSCHR